MNTRIGVLGIVICAINGTTYACGNGMGFGEFVAPELTTSMLACILLLSSLVAIAYICILFTKPIYLHFKNKITKSPSPLTIIFLLMIYLISHYAGRHLIYSNTPMVDYHEFEVHPTNLPIIISSYNSALFYLEIYSTLSLILFLRIFVKDRENAKGQLFFGKLLPIGIFITLFGAIAFSFILPTISRISQQLS